MITIYPRIEELVLSVYILLKMKIILFSIVLATTKLDLVAIMPTFGIRGRI